MFVNPTLDELAAAAEDESLTMIQLHGDEGPAFCQEAARRTGCKVIKALRVRSRADIRAAEAYRTDFHLLDAHRPGTPGGTGERFDWELLAGRRSEVPLILAGGLTAENVADGVVAARPFAVDVASGVEAEPGRQGPRADGEVPGVRPAGVGRPVGWWRERGRDPGALRRLRRALRPRGPDSRPRRAVRRLGGRPRRLRVPGGARRPASRLRGAADAALPRRPSLGADRAPGLPEARGPRPYRRPQDQQRDRPGPARPPDGEAAGDRRDRRRSARRRGGDGLRAARPRVRRLHGHRGHPAPGAERRAHAPPRGRGRPGRGRRADPEGGGERGDPGLGRERAHHALHHRLRGGAGAVPGAGARSAAGDRRRGARAGAGGRVRRFPPG